MDKRILNLAIFAHVDAGKTTLTEQLLYQSGSIEVPGRVDAGTCCTDSLPVERERGISVRSDYLTFFWRDCQINLIDTPGHVDFTMDAQRAFLALDAALLVISAVEGIQSQTRTMWQLLRQASVPTLMFINKIDRSGARSRQVLDSIESEFKVPLLPLNRVLGEGDRNARVSPLFSRDEVDVEILERIAETDDDLLARYVEEEPIPHTMLLNALRDAVIKTRIHPVFHGASILNLGVDQLLDGLVDLLPNSHEDPLAPLSAVVFRIDNHPVLGRSAAVRILSGSIRTRDSIYNSALDLHEKVSRIEKRYPGKKEDIPCFSAGDIAGVWGLKQSRIGDFLGEKREGIRQLPTNTSLISIEVSPVKTEDYAALGAALQILCDEEPSLNLDWQKEERRFHIQVMGRIQIEILENMLQRRFGLQTLYGPPLVLYRETLVAEVTAAEDYTMPKPCWARLRFLLKPGPPNSGLVFHDRTTRDQLARPYLQEIERGLKGFFSQGPSGWEVTDIDITLEWAEDHVVHSRPGDFAIASAMAIMKGLSEAKTELLEPFLDFVIDIPHNLVHRVMGDIIQMRGEVISNDIREEFTVLKGSYPVASSLEYPLRLNSISGGQGRISSAFTGYRPCAAELGQIRPYRGVNPLDRAKYILHARRAL